jgi:hypothetical protein
MSNLPIYKLVGNNNKTTPINSLPADIKYVCGYTGNPFNGPVTHGTPKPMQYRGSKGPNYRVGEYVPQLKIISYHSWQ